MKTNELVAIFFKDFEECEEVSIQTYDGQDQLVDKVVGKRVLIERDCKFDSDYERQDSPVIKIKIEDKEMEHVDSSMLVADTGLINILDDYVKKIDVQNFNHNVPIVNSMINDSKNSFTSKRKAILIRKRNGTPIATYASNKVSVHKINVPKSTGIVIDGKNLFVYRCDYTIYDLNLIK